jgi:hypothetical protein
MGKRWAIVIGVAATGVMALGAQTASSTTGDPVDSTPPDLQLSGPKKQETQNRIGSAACDTGECRLKVLVTVSEPCTVRATGKLTNVKMDKLDPIGPWTLAPRPAGKPDNIGPGLYEAAQRREVRKALADGENVQAKVAVKATDAAGNVATARRTVKLVKSVPKP